MVSVEEPLLAHAIHERFALERPFTIARGTKTHADVVTVELRTARGARFLGEGVPYARYGESIDGSLRALDAMSGATTRLALEEVSARLTGAARNALSSALFAATEPALARDALDGFDLAHSAATVVLGAPSEMADTARRIPAARLLKVKLRGDGGDLERLEAVHLARPDIGLWVDANEGLDADAFSALAPHFGRLGVVLVEQPVPAGAEDRAELEACPTPVCADESFLDARDAERIASAGYRGVVVKLDKAGGIHDACNAARAAHARGLFVAMGCMVCTSLSIAAAFQAVKMLANEGIHVPFLDLDGATFLSRDRDLDDTGWGARGSR